jgi:hypothetical protein
MAIAVKADTSRKILQVTLNNEFIQTEAAAKILKEYNQIVGTVNCREYSLLIDCTEMGVLQTDAVDILIKMYNLYMQTGFTHIVFVKSKNPIQNMQLTKAAKAVPGFTGIFVDSLAEAVKACV